MPNALWYQPGMSQEESDKRLVEAVEINTRELAIELIKREKEGW